MSLQTSKDINPPFRYTYVTKIIFSLSDFRSVKNPNGIKALGTHLRRLRDARNLSQQELADLADLAKITIQRIENAKYCATIDVLISIAVALKISLSELVNFQTPKAKKK